MQACDRCHRRKSRCDRGLPACSQCERGNTPCLYTDRSRQPIYRHDYVEKLQKKLRRAEAKNNDLSQHLEILQRSTAGQSAHAFESSLPQTGAASEAMDEGLDTTPASLPEETSHVRAFVDGSDVTREVSYLSLNAGGERQFLGSASGVFFADLVRATVEPTSSGSHQETASGTEVRADRSARVTSPSHRTMLMEHDSLPPHELATDLVSAYLSHQYVAYPFLHRSSLLEAVELIYSDPSFYGAHPFEAFVFDMVLAIATSTVNRPDFRLLSGAESHYRRAMRHFYGVFKLRGVRPLQAILLLCQYRVSSSVQDTSASMWHLVGIAVRMSLELGLHRESTYKPTAGQKHHPINDIEPGFDSEIRRCCFWCVFAFDRIVSIVLGRPLALRMEDTDVCLPRGDDVPETTHLSGRTDDQVHASSPVDGDDTRIPDYLFVTGENRARSLIFVHILRYRILCGRILDSLHASRSPASTSEREQLQDDLATRLDEWKQETQSLRLSGVPLPSAFARSPSPFLSNEWFELRYHSAKLMLYRPSSLTFGTLPDGNTLQTIYSSARHCIHLYGSLHCSQRITYSWVTLHSVFLTSLTYIYAVGRYLQKRRQMASVTGFSSDQNFRLSPEPYPLDIVNDTRICSNVLVALSERWNPSRHCHEVIDRLGNAIVADAISLQNILSEPREAGKHTSHPQRLPHQEPTPNLPSETNQLFQQDSSLRSQQPVESVPSSVHMYSNMPLTTENDFGSFFDDLPNLYDQEFIGDPMMQLSQNWLV